jgi:hypothetical protein
VSEILSIVLSALVQIESGARPNAIGDGGKAVGILQIHPVMVEEANRIHGAARWTPADRRDPQASLAMARTVLAWHYERGVRDPVELACRWNRPDGTAGAEYRKKAEREVGRFSRKDAKSAKGGKKE